MFHRTGYSKFHLSRIRVLPYSACKYIHDTDDSEYLCGNRSLDNVGTRRIQSTFYLIMRLLASDTHYSIIVYNILFRLVLVKSQEKLKDLRPKNGFIVYIVRASQSLQFNAHGEWERYLFICHHIHIALVVQIEDSCGMVVIDDCDMRIGYVLDNTFLMSSNLGYGRYDLRSTTIRTFVCMQRFERHIYGL